MSLRTILGGIPASLGIGGLGLFSGQGEASLLTALTSLGSRIGVYVADETALAAIPAKDRADKQIVLVGSKLWYRNQSSSASAAAGSVVISGDSSTGRWLALDVDSVLAALLAGTGASQGASLVGVRDVAANFAGTTVEAVLAEIMSILAATTSGNGASKIGVFDTAATIVATTVEGALAELSARVPAIAGISGVVPRIQMGSLTLGAGGTVTINSGITITASSKVWTQLTSGGAATSGPRLRISGLTVGGAGVGAFTATAVDLASGNNAVTTDISVYDYLIIG